MAKRTALGKGLGAFFPEMNNQQESGTESDNHRNPYIDQRSQINVVLHVPVAHIRANPNQPRKDFDPISLQELSDSIKLHGLIQPITVRSIGSHRYELISGERRLRATRMAGLETIPSYVREVSDTQTIAFALIENVQREELNAIEIALAYQQLIEECALTQEEVATQVGKNRSTITNILRLLHLPPATQAALKNKTITTGHARSLLGVQPESVQEKILAKVIEEDWSVRRLEDFVRNLSPEKKKTKKGKIPTENELLLKDISKRLRSKLSTKVELKPKQEGGEIRIEYYSDEDLDRILHLFESLH